MIIFICCLFVYLCSFFLLRNSDRKDLKKGNKEGIGSIGREFFIMPILNTMLLVLLLVQFISETKIWAWITNEDLR